MSRWISVRALDIEQREMQNTGWVQNRDPDGRFGTGGSGGSGGSMKTSGDYRPEGKPFTGLSAGDTLQGPRLARVMGNPRVLIGHTIKTATTTVRVSRAMTKQSGGKETLHVSGTTPIGNSVDVQIRPNDGQIVTVVT